jgi:hypothetical protein
MKKAVRNEEREVTVAMIGFLLIFLSVIALSKWVLPRFGIGT